METAALELFFASQWTTTIERSEKSMDPDDLEMIGSFESWGDVQNQILQSVSPSFALIQPALGHLSIFVEFFKERLGPELDASFVWGSLACLIHLAEDPKSFGKIPRMLKSFAHKAEAFNSYVKEVGVISNLIKETCFDMQVLFVEFFVSSINYIHGAGEFAEYGGSLRQQESGSVIQLIERRYTSTNHELEEALMRVEKLVRVKSSSLVQSPRSTNPNPGPPQSRCLMLPHTKTARFFNRVDVFEKLDEILCPSVERTLFRSVALYGLGGVGKSAVASTYVEKKFIQNGYDVILWVHAERSSSLRQSFTDIATRLKLPGVQPQLHDENLILVQDWFQSTESRWLIVYDNIESSEVLMPYWPGSSQGKAILTTRNHSLAFEPAAFGIEVTSWDAQTGSEFLLFLLKKNIGRDLETEGNSALVLSEKLSGHALAISHMAGLIHNAAFSIQEFMTMYLRNPRRAHATNELAALWDFSFKSLDKDSFTFLRILSFLMPDNIPQKLFDESTDWELSEDMSFCLDEFSFSQVLRTLITLALIKRNRDTRVLSIHRMVQTQFKYFLNPEDRQKSFNDTVMLILGVFPQEDHTKGQFYEVWETCNQYLQHVLNLKDCFTEEMKMSKSFKVTWQFCELLNRCQRYLYEANALADLKSLCDANLVAVETLEDGPQKDDLRATIMSHQANLAESLGEAEKSIDLNNKVYQIRLHENPKKQMLLCYVTNNLGYCHNTANNHKESLQWFQKAREWGTLGGSQRDTGICPPFILKNTARCMVYLGDLKGAKELLDISISLLKNSKNWAMLAYAYFVLGTIDRRQHDFDSAEAHFIDAQNFWLKGDQTRLHPFNGGCMYKIGACSLDQFKVEAAVKHIHDSMEVTRFHQNSMPIEHARNLFKLSEALHQDGESDSQSKAEALRDEAEIYLKRRKPDVTSHDTEDAYDSLIPIFWR